MRILSGKNAGKLSEVVFLKMPDLAQWMMNKVQDNALTTDFKRLRRIFDQKPISEKICHGRTEDAVTATAYAGSSHLMFWCEGCDPYSAGALSGKLDIVTTFGDAMGHADFTCNGNRAVKRNMIRDLATAKGLPKRITESAALKFFA